MNETSKTVAFLITGCLFAAAAASSWWMTQPKPVGGYEKVGEEFFPEFADAQAALSVEVIAFDDETDDVKEFSVAKKDDLWRIPSHHDYPAEAAERLARTATSMLGVVRESCVNRRSSEHAKYGVLDPQNPDATEDTAGKRITLRDEDGEILADYIIGKPAGSVAEEPNGMARTENLEPDFYYVRVPEEKETYKAKVEIDLSTKFSDWINPDLLKVEADEITQLEIDDYELKEEEVATPIGVQINYSQQTNDRMRLTREGFSPWQLEGMDPATQEIISLPIESTLTMLDQMKIAGVRPKLKVDGQRLLNSDLSINEKLARENPEGFRANLIRLQAQLAQKGFTLGASSDAPTKVGLLGARGEFRAITSTGVKYTIYFGRAVTGSETEIEIGDSQNEALSDDEKGESSAGNAGNNSSLTEAEEPAAAGEKRSRYVAIRVDFDPAGLGEVPTMPTEPTVPKKPEGYDGWKAKRDAELTKQPETADESDEKKQQAEGDAPDAPDEIEASNQQEFEAYALAALAFEQAKIQYTTDTELFEVNKADYDAKEKEGRELVKELNERFADWYYVVPASSLEKLKLKRGDLVKVKEIAIPPMQPTTITNPMADPNRLPQAPALDFEMPKDDQASDDSTPKQKAADEKAEGKKSEESVDEKDASLSEGDAEAAEKSGGDGSEENDNR